MIGPGRELIELSADDAIKPRLTRDPAPGVPIEGGAFAYFPLIGVPFLWA